MEYFVAHWEEILLSVTGMVTAATGITAVLPTTSPSIFLNDVLKILNVLAGNVLKNKNADAEPVKTEDVTEG